MYRTAHRGSILREIIRKQLVEMGLREWAFNEMPMISLSKDKRVMADDKPLKDLNVDAISNNIVFFRMPEGKRSIFAPGTTWIYFMDSEESAKEMEEGKIPMLVIPIGTFQSGGSPITDVWKKRFFQKGEDQPRQRIIGNKREMISGTDKILGLIQGHSDENTIYVDMMSVRPPYKRNSINSKMIQFLQQRFPKAKLSYSKLTPQGKKFAQGYKEGFEDEEYDKPGDWAENSPEVQASINMINDLKTIPKVESWRGASTWDFGNGVYISLGNQARNVRSDILFGWSRPKSQPPFIWYVENIASNEKGQGFASQAMKKLLAMADKNGITLRLWPHRSVSKPKDKKGTLDDKKLLQWYQRLGFQPIPLSQGNSRYYERKPQ
jgi:GNAT superfamily N-acetyltransferase